MELTRGRKAAVHNGKADLPDMQEKRYCGEIMDKVSAFCGAGVYGALQGV